MQETIKFFKHLTQHPELADGSKYGDYVGHCKNYKQYWQPGDRVTSSHECTHGTNSDIRNNPPSSIPRLQLSKSVNELYKTNAAYLGSRINAFYVGEDRAIVLPEPNINKSACIEFIPNELRASRFKLYIEGQKDWEDSPLYIWDEHTAYINGADTAGDDIEHGKDTGKNTDVLFGPIEFNIYSIAMMMAVEKGDNSSLPNLVPFFLWNMQRAFNLYHKYKDKLSFTGMDDFFKNLQSGQAGSSIRAFLKKTCSYEIPAEVMPDFDLTLKREDFDL